MIALKQKGISIENIFIDKESGKHFNRNSWQSLMAKLVVGDTIVIKELIEWEEIIKRSKKILNL